MEKKLFFVYNPKAGKGLLKTKLADIVDIFTKAGYETIVYPTQTKGDGYEKVVEYQARVDVVVCSGGDGTLDEVVSALMACGSQTPLGYIPAGSTNDFAHSLYIPKDMIKAAEAIAEGHIYRCDVGRFNGGTFVYIAAFGLFTDVAYETNQDLKNILGHLAYLLEGVKRLLDIKAYHCKIQAGEKFLEGDFIYGMITNSRSVGGFKHLTGKNVDMNDGLFEVTLIRKPKNPLDMNEIITSLLMAEDRSEMIDSFKAGSLTVTAEESIPWTLDGEYGGAHKQVEIENQKEAMGIFLTEQKHSVVKIADKN